jgi:hypothetical protein
LSSFPSGFSPITAVCFLINTKPIAQVVSSELPYPSVKTQFRWPFLRLSGPLDHFGADAIGTISQSLVLGSKWQRDRCGRAQSLPGVNRNLITHPSHGALAQR